MGYHAKFQPIRPSTLVWRGSGDEKGDVIRVNLYILPVSRRKNDQKARDSLLRQIGLQEAVQEIAYPGDRGRGKLVT